MENDDKDLLSYSNLNELLLSKKQVVVRHRGYIAHIGYLVSHSFIALTNMEHQSKKNKTLDGMLLHKHDAKFHISLPEPHREQYAKAWDIIKDILIEHQVSFFKVAHEGTRMSQASFGMQRGKDITIYASYDPDKDILAWQTLFQDITAALTKQGIPPGFTPPETGKRRDKALNGSNYISYRYEKQPWPENDICQKIQIKVANQLPPLQWVPAFSLLLRIESQLRAHHYVLNYGGTTINEKKYSKNAAEILMLLNEVIPTKNEMKAKDTLSQIKKKLQDKTKATSDGCLCCFGLFKWGRRDKTTASLYHHIMSSIDDLETNAASHSNLLLK